MGFPSMKEGRTPGPEVPFCFSAFGGPFLLNNNNNNKKVEKERTLSYDCLRLKKNTIQAGFMIII